MTAGARAFRYGDLRFDWSSGVAEFDFVHEDSTGDRAFTEALEFPLPEDGPDGVDAESFHRILELLHVAVGTAYYRLLAPGAVVADAVPLAPAAARWAEALYHDGMAEFAYNEDLEYILDLPLHTRSRPPVPAWRLGDASQRPPLVAFGGGKDSIVALEVLASAGLGPATFVIGREPRPQLTEMVSRTPGASHWVGIRPDPQLAPLMRQKAVRSGHAPVTAMTSLVGVAVAALHGLGPVVLAVERSADEGNLVWRGRVVNHQWSKSTAAEAALDDAIREHAGLAGSCFSLLRGLSELEIARLFATLDGYDALVTSCNVVARPTYPRSGDRWCLDCAKCRWVFLVLAPFMTRPRVVGVFGRDLLDDPRQIEGYRALSGVVGHKPFECVGEIAEARVALERLSDDPAWQDAAVLRALAGATPPVPPAVAAQVWRVDVVASAPAAYQAALGRWSPLSPPSSKGGS